MASLTEDGQYVADMYQYFMFTRLHHVGNDDYYGKPFYPEPWQTENIFEPVFGTGEYDDDGNWKRAYRRVLIGLPRNFGKTESIAALALTVANLEPRQAGQYGVVASSKDQASKIVGAIKRMIRLDSDLNVIWDTSLKSVIVNRENESTIVVFPYSESQLQSWHFNLLIADEIHVWKDDSVWNAAVSGTRSIPNSLILGITTAGAAREGFLWNLIPQLYEDPSAYIWWHGARDDEDIDDEEMWERLAIPSWVTVEDYREQRRALSKKAFERYMLNRFPLEKTADHALDADDIAACEEIEGSFDFDQPFTIAIDGATSGDSFAIVAHQIDEDGIDQFHTWVFDDPGERGYYDLNQIEQLVLDIYQRYRCPIGIDQARLLLMAQQLQDAGVEIYIIRQDNKTMCPACAMVVNSVRCHEMALGGHPKLAEHLANCRELEREPFGMRFTSLRHGQGTERIDAAIAAAMAKWMTSVMPRSETFADSGGVFII